LAGLAGWCFAPLPSSGVAGKELQVVAVGDIVPADNLAYLLNTIYPGPFSGQVSSKKSSSDKLEDDVADRRWE